MVFSHQLSQCHHSDGDADIPDVWRTASVSSLFWSFMLYLITQLLWVLPIALFFISIFAWGWARERLAIGCCIAGWCINLLTFYIVLTS